MNQHSQLLASTIQVFEELNDTLSQLDDNVFATSSQHLNGSTIGQHVRHIIELYQCLEAGYEAGIVNYDNRKRDLRLQTEIKFAESTLSEIIAMLGREEKPMLMETALGTDDGFTMISTNYYREVVYNLEHTIHHMALIRVAIQELTPLILSASFGVAPATLKFRKLCAQ
ncbi:hypothetical protein BH11BAC2_BH11BAC2_19780 [soil metagenome]